MFFAIFDFRAILIFGCITAMCGCHAMRAPQNFPQNLSQTSSQTTSGISPISTVQPAPELLPQTSYAAAKTDFPPSAIPLPQSEHAEILQVGFSDFSSQTNPANAAEKKTDQQTANNWANEFEAKVFETLLSPHWRRSRPAHDKNASKKTLRENSPRNNFDAAAQQRNEQWRRLNSLKDGKQITSQVSVAAYEDSPFRWSNDAVESLLLQENESEKNFIVEILHKLAANQNPEINKIASTNAAILIARTSLLAHVAQNVAINLSLAAQNEQFPLPLRCAAIEALSFLSVDAREVFAALASQTAERMINSDVPNTVKNSSLGNLAAQRGGDIAEGEASSPTRLGYEVRVQRFLPGISEIYIESLVAWSQQDFPQQNFPYEQLANALGARSVSTRQEVMRLWRDAPSDAITQHQKLPEIFSELWEKEQDIETLSAIPLTLVRWQHVDRFFILRRLLMHQQAAVRVAAIEALGECDNVAEAVKLLENPRRDSAAKTRAAVATAFIALNQDELLLSMADDTSSEVRVCVASRLGVSGTSPRTPQVEEIAQRYLNDPALAVIKTTIHSLAMWDTPTAGKLLLESLTHRSVAVRVLAAEELKKIWSDFAQYDTRKFSGKRDDEWNEMYRAFEIFCEQKSFPTPKKNLARVAMSDETLRETIEKNLTSNDLMERRRAAQKLAQETKQRAIPVAWRELLFDIALRERDGIVVQYLLDAASRDAPEESVRWGVALLHHSTIEVRRAACALLAKSGSANEAIALLELLNDENREVIQASLVALEKLSPQINSDAQIRREVVRCVAPLLGDASYFVRADAAAVLYRLHIREGRETLERLAQANDTGTQLYAAQRIADVGGAEFAPLMEKLAHENGSVRRIAQNALESWKSFRTNK